MKKNQKIISLFTIIGLSFVILSGTIAYFTDNKELTNEFTVGNVEIELNEENFKENKLVPGKTIPKDPQVTVLKGSEPSYVFMAIDNKIQSALDLEEGMLVSDKWKKIHDEGTLSYYVYDGGEGEAEIVEAEKENKVLDHLFTEIKVSPVIGKSVLETLSNEGAKIEIAAYAHQANHVEYETVKENAINHFNELFNE